MKWFSRSTAQSVTHWRTQSCGGFRGETTEERYIRLDKFLETHHAKDPELRANIVNFLVGLSAQ